MKYAKLAYYVLLFALFTNYVVSNYRDTGYRKIKQPNGIEFIGRTFGDEFDVRSITENGYVYVINPSTGWAYYAVLNNKGDYLASNARVGIDNPPSQINLERSKLFQENIRQRRSEFNSKQNIYSQKSSVEEQQTQTVGVLLVEFNDVTHHIDNIIGRSHGYKLDDFQNLFFSENYYNTSNNNVYGPEGNSVYGSIKDYYLEMSAGNYSLNGEVVNLEHEHYSDVPQWVSIPYSKEECAEMSISQEQYPQYYSTTWPGVAILAAEAQIPGFNRNNYDKIAILYAGAYGGGTLHPAAIYLSGKYYWTSEMDGDRFTTIGVNCHELGHALFGFPDQYEAQGASEKPQPGYEDYTYHGLMARGDANGPLYNPGVAPAPLEPVFRVYRNWGNIRTLNQGEFLDTTLNDNNDSPKFFRIMISRTNVNPDDYFMSKYYIIENRQRKSFYDQFVPPGGANEEGILIWEKFAYGYETGVGNKIDLIEADDNWNIQNNYFPDTTDTKAFIGDGGGGFIIKSKSLINGEYVYSLELYGDGYNWNKTISEKAMLSGVIVASNLVFNNKTYLLAGTNIKFNSSGTIVFNNGGYLITNGTDSYPVTFNANSSTWNGILLSGEQASNSVLKYLKINNVLTYGGSALTVSGTSGISISNCTITNNTLYGTSGISFINAGQPNIHENVISGNGGYGIRFQNTNGNIWSNKIENNSTGGINIYYFSSPVFGYAGFPAYNGNNIISGGSYGIYTSYYSNPYIGSQLTSNYGYNSIAASSIYRLSGSNYSSVLAENNWWGVSNPSPNLFYNDLTSSVEYNPWLVSPPGGNSQLLSKSESLSNINKEKLRIAKTSILNNDYDKAVKLLFNILSSDTLTKESYFSLVELISLYKSSADENIVSFVENKISQKLKKLPFYQDVVLRMYSKKNNAEIHNKIFSTILQSKENSEEIIPFFLDDYYYKINQNRSSYEDKKKLKDLLQRFNSNDNLQEAMWLTENFYTNNYSLKKNNSIYNPEYAAGWESTKLGDNFFSYIIAPDTTTIYLISDTIFVSLDNGASWNYFNVLSIGQLYCFFAASAEIWYGGARGGIFKTTDKGKTWQSYSVKVLDGNLYNVTSLFFFNENIGWAIAGKYIEKTTDGGKTWNIADSSNYGAYTIKYVSEKKGFVFTSNKQILSTMDGGLTWNAKTVDGLKTDAIVYSVVFSDSLNGVGVGRLGTVMRTSDGGANWSVQQLSIGNSHLKSVYFVNKDTGWAVGWYGFIYRTNDGGATWEQQVSNTTVNLNAIYFTSNTNGIIVGEKGLILTTTTGGIPTQVSSLQNLTKNFLLSQNYPNPFNPTTMVNYQIPKDGNVTIKVFDNLGREVATLVNEYKTTGRYSVEFNASKLSSGVYYYLLTSGEYKSVKKMVVMK